MKKVDILYQVLECSLKLTATTFVNKTKQTQQKLNIMDRKQTLYKKQWALIIIPVSYKVVLNLCLTRLAKANSHEARKSVDKERDICFVYTITMSHIFITYFVWKYLAQ